MRDETSFRLFADGLVSGDDEAARELLGRYASRLVALAQHQLSPRLQGKVAPEDVMQSVFRTFFRRLNAGEFELRGWGSLWGLLSLLTLRKVQRNVDWYTTLGRDVSREISLSIGPGKRLEVAIPDRDPTPDEAAAFADEFETLLVDLDERDRKTISLLFAGESPQAVATEVGCSQRTVRRTIARVRDRLLRRRLQE